MKSVFWRVIINVFGCLAFLCIPILFSPDFNRGVSLFLIPPFQKEFSVHVLLLGFFYFNYLVLIPKLYFKQRYFLFFSIVIVCFFLIPYIPGMFINITYDNSVVNEFPQPRLPGGVYTFLRSFLQFIIVFTLSFMIKIYFKWKKTEAEKLTTELSFLKAQINPHFLFNTLNSIYSLSIAKSDSTPDAIVMLANMMRYVITDVNENFVDLEKEVAYIRDYIELQKVRLAPTVKLSYTLSVIGEGQKIAPMTLIPFIENAFKYGVNSDEPSNICINLYVKNKRLQMEVINTKVFFKEDALVKTGVGLENTRTRLNLIYPGNHELSVIDGKEEFEVKLNIMLI